MTERPGDEAPSTDAAAAEASGRPDVPPPVGAETGRQTTETAPTGSTRPAADPLAASRVGQAWVAIIVFAILLILLLIFVLQNTEQVEISYFGWTFAMPLSVAILLAAVVGVLLTAVAGTWRILQLRKRMKKTQQAAG